MRSPASAHAAVLADNDPGGIRQASFSASARKAAYAKVQMKRHIVAVLKTLPDWQGGGE